MLARTNSRSVAVGRDVLGSCRPITLGVTQEQQLREMKAGEGSAQLGGRGAGLAGQPRPAAGLVRGVRSGPSACRATPSRQLGHGW